MYQVQIYVSEVGEWYGWAHSQSMFETEAEGKKAARAVAREYGWQTRCVEVR